MKLLTWIGRDSCTFCLQSIKRLENSVVRQIAINRYKLLYQLPQDSLLHAFQKLDSLLKTYHVESSINPPNLTQDVFRLRRKDRDELYQIRNNFDRNALIEKIKVLNRLFY